MYKHFERESMIWGSDLSQTEKILLLALNSFVDAYGRCFPGQETLAKMCSVEERTIRRTIKGLEDRGILQRTRRYKQGKRTSDEKRINFGLLAEFAGETLPDKMSPNLPDTGSGNDDLTGHCVRPYRTLCPTLPDPRSGDLSRDLPSEPILKQTDLSERVSNARGREEESPPCSEIASLDWKTDPDTLPSHSEPAAWLVKRNASGGGQLSAAPAAIDVAAWSQAYNRYKPDKWLPASLLAPVDVQGVQAAVGSYGSESAALDAFVLALTWVRVGGEDMAWWRDKQHRFATLLNPKKLDLIGFSDAARAAGVNPDAIAASDYTDADAGLLEFLQAKPVRFGGAAS